MRRGEEGRWSREGRLRSGGSASHLGSIPESAVVPKQPVEVPGESASHSGSIPELAVKPVVSSTVRVDSPVKNPFPAQNLRAQFASVIPKPLPTPPVDEVEIGGKLCDSTWYPESWMSKCATDKTQLGIVVLSPVTLPFWGPDGKRYIKFPAWHKETGSLVFVLAPALNHSEDSILRDCPQLIRYRPMIPEDIPGAQQIVPATDLKEISLSRPKVWQNMVLVLSNFNCDVCGLQIT